jgi:hypothetical protein
VADSSRDLDQPLSRDQHALLPQQTSKVRYLPIRNREPVSVRRHHAKQRLPLLLLPFQKDSRQVVSRLVPRGKGAHAVHQPAERFRIHGDGLPLRSLRHLRKLRASQARQTEVASPRRDLHVIPLAPRNRDLPFGEHLRDVEQFPRREGDGTGLDHVHRLGAADDDLEVGGHEREPRAPRRSRLGPHGEKGVGQDRHGMPPLRHSLDTGKSFL